MQKRQTKRHIGRGSRKFRNWNLELSESARNTVLGIANSIDSREDFAFSYLRESYLSKYCDESLVPGAERKQNAIDKWIETELRNAHTNDWWRSVDPGYNLLPRVSVSSFLRHCRRLIRDVLGPLHDEVVLGSFSGGASTSRSRTVSHPANKFSGKADITEEAKCVIDLVERLSPMLREHESFSHPNIVKGNVLFTVPKKTDIDRCACKEPDINMYLQKGVGSHIRRRLRKYGINLNDQSVNRRLAELGSRDQSLATLDLSSASDSMTVEVIRTLLPADWFAYLDCIRSHNTLVGDRYFRLEMFSSMGNGFTFELESLLFWAIGKSVLYFEGISGVLSVYGDDIIAPTGAFDLLTFVLGKFGFLPNYNKSFSTGFFRESCGGHYHMGEDVTPFYLKRMPTRLTDLIRAANQLRMWSLSRDPYRQYIDPALYRLWLELANHVPKDLWGGYDYSVDTQLVSPPIQRISNVLIRVSDSQEVDEVGRYLHWHNSNWNRTDLPETEGREPISTNQKCRKRRTKPGAPVCSELFQKELGATGFLD